MNILRHLLIQHRSHIGRNGLLLRIGSVRPTHQPALHRYLHEISTNRLLLPATVSDLNRSGERSYAVKAKPGIKHVKVTGTLLDELKADARAHRRVHLDKVNVILASPESIPEDAYNFLLSCCGTLLMDQPVEARMKLFKNLWFMAGGGDKPALSATPLDRWKVLLRVYRENGVDLEEGVGPFVGSVGSDRDLEFFELLLAVVCERGDVPKMMEVMEVLEDEGFGLNTRLAGALIRGYSKVGELKAVRTVLDTMSAGNIESDEGVFGELVIGHLANGQIETAVKLIKEKGILLKEHHIVEGVKEALLKNRTEVLRLMVKLLPEDVRNDSNIDPTLRNLCSELLRCKQFESVRTLLAELPIPKYSLNESCDSYGVSLISEMVKTKAPFEEIVQFVDFLVKTERNIRALHVACECAAKSGNEAYQDLLGVLGKQEDLRPHYFWPLIVQNFDERGEAGILDTLKLMQRFRTELDSETITVFILPKLSLTLKDVRTALKQFEDRGVKMSSLMTPFVSHLLYQNRFEDTNRVVQLYSSKVDTEALIWPLVLQATVIKSSEHFAKVSEVIRQLMDKAQNGKHDLGGQLLMELISNRKTKHDSTTLKSLLKQFEKFQIRISRMCANVLSNHFSKSKRNDTELDKLVKSLVDEKLSIPSKELFDSIIVHPRDMSYEELECHLNELEEKKLNSRGVLRRLLQVCVRENRLDRAVEVKQKCDDARVELSSGMLASVLDLHIKRKNVDEAGKTLEQIKSKFPGFLIDEHKIIDFAALLAENGFLSTAQKILKQRASSGQIRTGNSNKNIWNLLTNTAQWAAKSEAGADKNQTNEMLIFLVDHGYCTYDNALLGPVIREYLLKNQIRNAVTEFKRIAAEKRRTPLQLEIFTTLVKLTNSADPDIAPEEAKALLAEVIQVGSKIHGAINTNNTLIVALADAGTEAQLRRILINPESRVNHEYILTQCEFLLNSGKLDVVLRLAKCSRGLANVKEADFLGVILKQYLRENNCEAAIELFNRLQADDEEVKITGEFARKVVDLLEVNNYEVPDGIRLYAK